MTFASSYHIYSVEIMLGATSIRGHVEQTVVSGAGVPKSTINPECTTSIGKHKEKAI